jgi:phenylalanyl-tRNA synthetase alpha chain
MSVPKHIQEKIGRNLFLNPNHPISIIKEKIYEYFGNSYMKIENFPVEVSTVKNFDDLCIEKDHPSRSKSDTYYISKNVVLRTHMTAFLTTVLNNYQNKIYYGDYKNFLFVGDVYRKDEIDSSHYPVFHQLDGLCIIDKDKNPIDEIKKTIGGLIEYLFPGCDYNFNDEYYPFNSKAFEVNVNYNGKMIEVLGCGIKRPDILEKFGITDKQAWGFGLGLDRLAMIFFDIPDIRYMWSEDERFISQFEQGKITHFKSFAKHPPIHKDISFFREKDFNLNEFYEICREKAGDLIEDINLFDKYYSEKEKKESVSFRINYNSNERNLTSQEVNEIHDSIKAEINKNISLKLR